MDLLLRLGILPDIYLASASSRMEIAVVKVNKNVGNTVLGACQVFEEENEFVSAGSG